MFTAHPQQQPDEVRAEAATAVVRRRAWRVAALCGAAVLVAVLALALPAGALAQVSFGGATSYGLAAGADPNSVAVGDFNQDSDPDLAVANAGSGNVSVLLGGADGSFGPATNYASGTHPRTVAVGDFNQDSDPDLAVANEGSDDVSVLLGGDGASFGAATNLPVGDALSSVAVADFNSDSDPDLAVANGSCRVPGCSVFSSPGSVSVLLGGQGGSFTETSKVDVGVDPSSVAVGDFDGRAGPDLAVANRLSKSVSVLFNQGFGRFAAAPAVHLDGFDEPNSVAVGDFDGVHGPDLAVAKHQFIDPFFSGEVSVMLNLPDGTGAFGSPTSYWSDFAAPNSIAVADFNGDLKPDLGFTNGAGDQGADNVSVLANNFGGGGVNFFKAAGRRVGSAPNAVAVGDLDNDSDLDVAVTDAGSDDVSVLLNKLRNAPPRDANEDIYQALEDTPLHIAAPGVLSDDTDPEGDALSAVLESEPSHGSVTLNSDGSFVYTPNRNFDEFDTFTYRASDGTAKSEPVTVFILIRPFPDAPVANDDTYATDEDTPLTIDAAGVLGNDSDGDGDNLTAALASDPAHGSLTFNADGSGSFSYTPDAGFNGTDSFSYRASDGAAADTATVTIEVRPVNDAPAGGADTYTTDEDQWFRAGTGFNDSGPGVLANDSDPDGDPLEMDVVLGAARGWPTFFPDGSFIYQPEPNFNGTDTFSYRAYDGELYSETITVTINVTPVNDAPDANRDTYETDEDTPLELSAAAGVLSNDSDVEGDALSAAVASGPEHGNLALNPEDGSLSYIPNPNFNGTDGFSYRANDGQMDSDPATVTIEVRPANDAPGAAGDSYQTDEDTPLIMAAAEGVVANDRDIDGDPLAAGLVSGAVHGSLDLRGDGSLRYTPDRDYNGTDSFRYRANDGALDSGIATVTIDVKPVNDAPAAHADAYETDEDTTLEVAAAAGVLSNDSDVEGDAFSAAVVPGPAHGSLVLTPEGSLSYTPEPDFTGSDSFEYRASDGADSGTATVTINVGAVADAPAAAGDAYGTDEDTPLRVAATEGVLANDSDPDGDDLTAALVSGPGHGSLELGGDGSLSYTPERDYNGSDSFSYRAFDGGLDSDPVTVTIDVRPMDEPPPAGPAQPPAGFTIGSVRFKHGSTVVSVLVPGPGTVTTQQVRASTARVSAAATKKKTLVKRTRKVATKAGPIRLTLKPTKAGMKLLRHKKTLTTRIRFTFTPSGGTAKSTFKKITIKLKKR